MAARSLCIYIYKFNTEIKLIARKQEVFSVKLVNFLKPKFRVKVTSRTVGHYLLFPTI